MEFIAQLANNELRSNEQRLAIDAVQKGFDVIYDLRIGDKGTVPGYLYRPLIDTRTDKRHPPSRGLRCISI